MAYKTRYGKLVREYPRGKIEPGDEGALEVAIYADHANGVVVLDFPKPVHWFALEGDKVDQLIEVLKKRREELN